MSLPAVLWAYGRADGEDMGDYRFLLAHDRAEAQGLAGDYAGDDFGYGEEAASMVVYEVRPVTIGTPVVARGEDLGDGDREPDEFKWLEWRAVDG